MAGRRLAIDAVLAGALVLPATASAAPIRECGRGYSTAPYPNPVHNMTTRNLRCRYAKRMVEAAGFISGEADRPKSAAEMDRNAFRLKEAQRRFDKGNRKAPRRHERPAGATARPERLAQQLGGQACVSLVRFGVERGQQHGPPQALVERAGAGHGFADFG